MNLKVKVPNLALLRLLLFSAPFPFVLFSFVLFPFVLSRVSSP